MDELQALVRHVETLGRSYRAIANVVPTCVLYGFILTCHFASIGPVPLLYGYHDAVS